MAFKGEFLWWYSSFRQFFFLVEVLFWKQSWKSVLFHNSMPNRKCSRYYIGSDGLQWRHLLEIEFKIQLFSNSVFFSQSSKKVAVCSLSTSKILSKIVFYGRNEKKKENPFPSRLLLHFYHPCLLSPFRSLSLHQTLPVLLLSRKHLLEGGYVFGKGHLLQNRAHGIS